MLTPSIHWVTKPDELGEFFMFTNKMICQIVTVKPNRA